MQADVRTLIARYLDGDPEVYRLVDGWIERAASPFRGRVGGEWHDLLQSARAEVTRQLRRDAFRGEAALSTYIWRVVNHVCIDHLRARRKTAWTDIDEIDEPSAGSEASPLAQVLKDESRQRLLELLEEVPAECRRLWALILAGRSYSEMSHEVGVSEGALRVRVLRCRKKAIEMRDQMAAKAGAARDVTPIAAGRLTEKDGMR